MTTGGGGVVTPDERIGTLLADRYSIDSIVGRGGMSVVYRATDTFLGRTVALKVFRAELADADDLRRQRAEIQLLASLNHPTLVTLFDAVAGDDDRVSLVLEYVEGSDLRAEITAGTIDELATAEIGADIAEALAYIHDRGIVHRDMKPGNLLVPVRTPGHTGPRAKLADFGIARLIDGTQHTAVGSVIGTAGYLSPEQALGTAIGPPSDVYSLGLVLLECLTGVRAFEGSALESAMARLSRDPEIPRSIAPVWVDILRRMTAREPSDRVAAADLGRELRALAQVIPGTEAEEPTRVLESGAPTSRLDAEAATSRMDVDEQTGRMDVDAPTSRMDAAPVDPTQATRRLDLDPTAATGQDADRAAGLAASREAATAVFATKPPAQKSNNKQSKKPAELPADSERPAGRFGSRRRMILVGLAVLVGLIAIVWATQSIGAPSTDADPAPIEYPVVEGDLGGHLEQLQRSVEQ